MPDIDYVIYDTAPFNNVAATTHELFQVAQGGDATHTESFTNSRGAGQLPTKENFLVNWIGWTVDYNTVEADLPKIHIGSYLKFILNNFVILQAPLALFAASNSYGGLYTQAAAAAEAMIGLQGKGFMLDIPILVPGGTQFKVQIFQSLALAGAANQKISLRGKLTVS